MKKRIVIFLLFITGLILLWWRNASISNHENVTARLDATADENIAPALFDLATNVPPYEATPPHLRVTNPNTNPFVWIEDPFLGPRRVRADPEMARSVAIYEAQDEKRRLERQEEDLRLGINQEERDREQKLKKLSIGLRNRMTADEVVALLGEPTAVQALRINEGPFGEHSFVSIVRTNQPYEKGFTYFRYSPAEGGRISYQTTRDSFQILSIRFDSDLQVGFWRWESPMVWTIRMSKELQVRKP